MINSEIRKLEGEIGELNQKLYDKKVELNSMRNKELDSYVGKFFKVNGQSVYGYAEKIMENGVLRCHVVDFDCYDSGIYFDKDAVLIDEIDFAEEYKNEVIVKFNEVTNKFNKFMAMGKE